MHKANKKDGWRCGCRAVGAVPGVATGEWKAARPTIEGLPHPVCPAHPLSIIVLLVAESHRAWQIVSNHTGAHSGDAHTEAQFRTHSR